jgi:two-component system sensor histidine kinase VicK
MPIRFKIVLIFTFCSLIGFGVLASFIFTSFPDAFQVMISFKGVLIILLSLTLILLGSVIFHFLVSKFILIPVLYLTRAARKIRDGELNMQFHYHSRNEIGQLSQALSEMTKEIKNSYNELKQEQLKDEVIIDNIGDAVIVVNEKGEMAMVNAVAEEMFAIKDTHMVARSIYETIIVEDDKETPFPFDKWPMMEAFTKGIGTRFYGFVSSKNNKQKVPVIITASPLILGDEIIGAVNVFHDMTREHEMEQAKDEFVSIAAHQLRTPLGIMRWNIERLLSGRIGQVSQPVGKILKDIFNNDLQLIELVGNLLDVSRINQGGIRNTPIPIDVEKLIREFIDQMQDEIVKKSLAVTVNIIPEKLPMITIDPKLLRQIVQNLLSNAIKYTGTGGKVSINIDFKGNLLHIVVADNGIGVPLNEQQKVFQKFSRGSNAVHSDVEGTGLGLFVVKSYVEYLKGKITLTSEEGKGTRIEIGFRV